MESVAAGSRGGSLRKEWRAVSDSQQHNHHPLQNNGGGGGGGGGGEDLERLKLGQSNERTVYEVQRRRDPADVDFCAMSIDRNVDNDILQQQILNVARQREELQHMEIELRAQVIARTEIVQMQNRLNAEIKEHADAVQNFQEKLHEREHTIQDLERRIEEKDRELQAIRLDNQAAWANEDLLREQNKELATIRRERDHSEAERAQHVQQIHDLQEHIQVKERLILELQEQLRAAQESNFLKDEQLKIWVARAQEMDALQSKTNHSLQAELRERTEQYNQLWFGWQRQFAEMERLHLHAVQQLQLELADARERSGSYSEESHVPQSGSNDVTKYGQKTHDNSYQLDENGSCSLSANAGASSNGQTENTSSSVSVGNLSNLTNHIAGVPFAPSSLLGMPTYLPPRQVTAVHPYILHQQGILHPMPSNAHQSHVGQHDPMPAIPSVTQWQNQLATTNGSQSLTTNLCTSSPMDNSLVESKGKYECEISTNGQASCPDYLNFHVTQGAYPDSASIGETQVNGSCVVASKSDQNLQHISSRFNDTLSLNPLKKSSEPKGQEQNILNMSEKEFGSQILTEQSPSSVDTASQMDSSAHSVIIEAVNNSITNNGQTNVVMDWEASKTACLDERSLLACIVRTVPTGGKIRISTTLLNRLGKMLAPLQWHDYKKKHGRLDEFVASHPELFLIEDDHIQLREGAQGIIAATAAVAKVAAATAYASPHSSSMPSVAVTPIAQSQRLRKVPYNDIKRTNGSGLAVAGGVSNQKSGFVANGRPNSNLVTKQPQGKTIPTVGLRS